MGGLSCFSSVQNLTSFVFIIVINELITCYHDMLKYV